MYLYFFLLKCSKKKLETNLIEISLILEQGQIRKEHNKSSDQLKSLFEKKKITGKTDGTLGV